MSNVFRDVNFFLLDLDGTLYLGERLFEGVPEFLATLRETGRRYLFFTNNSSRDAAAYGEKLRRLGIPAVPGEIITSGEATVDYLKNTAGVGRVYVLGTECFEQEIAAGGILLENEAPEAVVLGFDLTLTYDKVRQACHFIRAGIPFVATHPDLNCPTPAGPIPDCGAITAMIIAATGVAPKIIGKPHQYMADTALRRLGAKPEETAIVGDRLYTDMEMGFSARLKTILVLSGESKAEDVEKSRQKPDGVFPGVADMIPLLKRDGHA